MSLTEHSERLYVMVLGAPIRVRVYISSSARLHSTRSHGDILTQTPDSSLPAPSRSVSPRGALCSFPLRLSPPPGISVRVMCVFVAVFIHQLALFAHTLNISYFSNSHCCCAVTHGE